MGCGPFVINRIDLNRGVITLAKNPHWKGTQPRFDAIEIHIFKNQDVLSLALEKGDVDVFYEYASSYPYASLNTARTGQQRCWKKPAISTRTATAFLRVWMEKT